MTAVLIKAFSFILLIAAGQFLKRMGIFGPRDHQIVVKIVMNITLPAAVIASFSGVQITPQLLAVMLIGLGVNVLLVFFGWLYSRKGSAADKAFAMLNFSGYNIGAFAMPYLQSFLGPSGVVIACMFDSGNAMVCTGGSYALTSAVVSGGKGEPVTLKSILKKLFSSTAFDTYLAMLLLTVLGIQVHPVILSLLAPAGAANAGVAMLLIGLMLQWEHKPGYLRKAITTVLVRNLVAVVGGLLFFFCTPFPLEIRQVVVIILFAPISVVAAAFTEKCGGDAGLAGFTNSLSILVSVGIITTLAVAMFGV
ncbi:MAG: AEC family transporter [Angelakisella sp.]